MAQAAATRLSELSPTERTPIARTLARAGDWELASELTAFHFRGASGVGFG